MENKSKSENGRHILVDPRYDNNRPKEKESTGSERKYGNDENGRRTKQLWYDILLNLIPLLVSTGLFFLFYVILPGEGYLHIFYSSLLSVGGLFLLDGIMADVPFKKDLSLYGILLIFLLAFFMAIKYQKPEAMTQPVQYAAPAYTSAPVVYGPGVYHFSLGPGERSISFIVSGDYYYEAMASSNDYIVIANGIRYRPSKKLIIPWASTTQLMFINNKKKSNNIILIVKYR
jgi:hypothetical protein